MLHLQPGVHFQQVEVARRIDHEFDRAGGAVADGFRQRNGGAAHFGAQFRRHERRRRLFDDFLVTALNRALTLSQVHHRAVAVGQDLDFNMARALKVFLHEHPPVAERRLRFPHGLLVTGAALGFILRDPHSAAAAAGLGFQQHRVADIGSRRGGGGGAFERLGPPGNRGHSRRRRDALGLQLVAHEPNRFRRRANEGNARLSHCRGECRVLRKKAVSRMQRGRRPTARTPQ